MELAAEYGLAGPGKFWLISGTADMAPFILGGALQLPKDSAAVKAIEGNGIYFCEGGVPGLGGAYDTFTKHWGGFDEQALQYINSKQPLKPDGTSYAFPPQLFAKRPHHVVTFSYDAAVGLALSACDALEGGHTNTSWREFLRRRKLADEMQHTSEVFTGHSHHAAFARSSFQGASGYIKFRESFPTRTAESSYFVLANLRTVEASPTHVKFMGSPVVNYFDTDESTWKVLGDNKFVYSDGSATPPIDMVPLEETGWSTGQAVGIAVIAVLFPMILIVLLLYQRDKKRRMSTGLWAVKTSELKFEDPPVVIGRGTFGLVLLANYRGTPVAVKRVIPPRMSKPKTDSGTHRCSDGNEPRLDEKFNLSNEYVPNGNAVNDSEKAELKAKIRRGSSSFIDEDDVWEDNGPGSRSMPSNSSGVKELPTSLGMMSGVSTKHGPGSRSMPPAGSSVTSLGMMSGVQSSTVDVNRGNAPKAKRGQKSATIFGLKSTRLDHYARLKSDFIAEMQQLSSLRHPCICTVMGAVIESASEPMLIMEYMSMGSLYGLLQNETVPLSGEIILPILQDVSKGLRFLHTANPSVLHGDLKAANILIDARFRGKVADFGLSQKKTIGAAGTPYWMASELLRGESGNTPASDVFSFGVVLYESYSRKAPYEGEDYNEVIKQVMDSNVQKRPPVPPHCPPQIQSMMAECLVDDASKRPTFEELDIRLQRLAAENVDPAESYQSMQITKQEHHNTEQIFYDQFPPTFAEALRQGRKVEPEAR